MNQLHFNYPCVLKKFLSGFMLSSKRSIQWWARQINFHSPNPNYESGATRVARDSEMVVKVTAAMVMNPFTAETTHLINM